MPFRALLDSILTAPVAGGQHVKSSSGYRATPRVSSKASSGSQGYPLVSSSSGYQRYPLISSTASVSSYQRNDLDVKYEEDELTRHSRLCAQEQGEESDLYEPNGAKRRRTSSPSKAARTASQIDNLCMGVNKISECMTGKQAIDPLQELRDDMAEAMAMFAGHYSYRSAMTPEKTVAGKKKIRADPSLFLVLDAGERLFGRS
jgi:hypothetical protein